MSVDFYRVLHLFGALMVFLGLGGMLAVSDGKAPKLYSALHGAGLLVMLVAGVGVLHKAGLAWNGLIFAKIACWVLLGAAPVLVRRGVLPRVGAVVLVLVIGGVAVWLAKTKPF
jgi:hypothetical protein